MSPRRTQETTIKQLPERRRGYRYRWDVVIYKPTDPTHPGVFDGRLHIGQNMGYTRTWLGAAIAVARQITRRVGVDGYRD